MTEKIRKVLDVVSDILELIMAIAVVVAIVIAVISLRKPFVDFIQDTMAINAFPNLLGYILNIVIGIEFLKMLCKPGTDTVLEVLMFVVTRHMIVQDTTAAQELMTIVGIAILLVIKKYLHSGSSFRSFWRKNKVQEDKASDKDQ